VCRPLRSVQCLLASPSDWHRHRRPGRTIPAQAFHPETISYRIWWNGSQGGLAHDNLLSAEVVLADGRFVTASARENDDLFWAIRGGGGNFGIVTSLEFQAHPVGLVLAAIVLHPAAAAAGAIRRGRDLEATAPDAPGGAEDEVRPNEPVPDKPEHRACLGCRHGGGCEVGLTGLPSTRALSFVRFAGSISVLPESFSCGVVTPRSRKTFPPTVKRLEIGLIRESVRRSARSTRWNACSTRVCGLPSSTC